MNLSERLIVNNTNNDTHDNMIKVIMNMDEKYEPLKIDLDLDDKINAIIKRLANMIKK